MNTSISIPDTDSLAVERAPHSPSFYERAVLGILERMTTGCLNLYLPSGVLKVIGSPDSANAATVRVLNGDFFRKCMLSGDIGLGESYVDGDWETDNLERVITWAISNAANCAALVDGKTSRSAAVVLRVYNKVLHWLRANTKANSRRNIAEHYDLGNAFYQLWLDPTMTYSSGLFQSRNQTLESAQIAKYDALCRKLALGPQDHVLEIGTGWGGFAKYAVQNYGCRVTTATISQEQFAYAEALFKKEGLSDRISVLLRDYRELTGQFDKIVSIEMLEAVGDRYLETYFRQCDQLLRPGGLLGLQYITVPDSRHAQLREGVDWIQKHIFPGSLLLSVGRISEVLNRSGDLFLHDLQDLGASYAETLHRWWKNFNGRLDEVHALGFDTRFIRKWNYYLQYCEAAFATRNISVVQAIYTRSNNLALHREFRS